MPNIKNEIWHEMSNIKTTVQSLWRNTSETAEQQLHAAPLAKTLTAANFWARSPLARARGRRITYTSKELSKNVVQKGSTDQNDLKIQKKRAKNVWQRCASILSHRKVF